MNFHIHEYFGKYKCMSSADLKKNSNPYRESTQSSKPHVSDTCKLKVKTDLSETEEFKSKSQPKVV